MYVLVFSSVLGGAVLPVAVVSSLSMAGDIVGGLLCIAFHIYILVLVLFGKMVTKKLFFFLCGH